MYFPGKTLIVVLRNEVSITTTWEAMLSDCTGNISWNLFRSAEFDAS
jgi:hypothetical protein